MTQSMNNRQEKRQNRRLNLYAHAHVKKNGSGFEFSGEITNISNMGAHLTTNCPLSIDDQLDLTIYFQHGANKLSMIVPCKVVRIDGKGVGLTSPHIDANLLSRLELISDLSKENTKLVIEEFFKTIQFTKRWE